MDTARAQHRDRSWSPARDEPVTISTSDGYELAGTILSGPSPRATIMISSGTAIPRRFYLPFATFLADRGYAVLTYDYRGIGDSRPDHMRGFEASKIVWGREDMSAAFGYLMARYPALPHYVFGHSVGGQLIGLMEAPGTIDGIATYGCGFGYWGGIEGNYKFFVAGLWYVAVPVGTALFGYMPAKSIGLGEDLPSGVARDWARWGRRRDYFTSELGQEPGFSSVDAPWRAFLASDDRIATQRNAAGLHAVYDNPIDVVTLDPMDYGYEDLGHLKFFSRSRRLAWDAIADFFDEQPQAR